MLSCRTSLLICRPVFLWLLFFPSLSRYNSTPFTLTLDSTDNPSPQSWHESCLALLDLYKLTVSQCSLCCCIVTAFADLQTDSTVSIICNAEHDSDGLYYTQICFLVPQILRSSYQCTRKFIEPLRTFCLANLQSFAGYFGLAEMPKCPANIKLFAGHLLMLDKMYVKIKPLRRTFSKFTGPVRWVQRISRTLASIHLHCTVCLRERFLKLLLFACSFKLILSVPFFSLIYFLIWFPIILRGIQKLW